MDEEALEMIEIVTTLWYGDRWKKEDRGEEYVLKLFNSIRRFTTVPFKFTLLQSGADMDKLNRPFIIYPLKASCWKYCFPKLMVFNPDLFDKGSRVFVFDLATVVTGNLDEIFSYRGPFITRREPNEKLSGGGLVSFEAGSEIALRVWDLVTNKTSEVLKITGGRERYFYRNWFSDVNEFWSELFPGQCVDYKYHVKPNGGVLPVGTRLVHFNGRPKPHQINSSWVKEHWR